MEYGYEIGRIIQEQKLTKCLNGMLCKKPK